MNPGRILEVAGGLASWIASPFLGASLLQQQLLAPEIRNSSLVSSGVQAYCNRWSEIPMPGTDAMRSDHVHPHEQKPDISSTNFEERPVFIFSAGWGSGSTLVQRLVISSGKAVIWGEPFDQTATVHRLAMSVAAIRQDWPPEYHFKSIDQPEVLTDEWIANLAPPHQSLKTAHQSFFRQWLSTAKGMEGKTWGLKEVRLTIDHARYLHWLYPNARFLFVYRDLHSSYLSCRRVDWLSVWPDYKVSPILAFAHHWRYLLEGFLSGFKDVDGMLIRYEDLVSGAFQLEKLENYLGYGNLDATLIGKKPVGARAARRTPLILPEKMVLDAVAGGLRKQLGYR